MPGAQLYELDPAGELDATHDIAGPGSGRRCSRQGLALLVSFFLCGCYTYRPLISPEPVPGTRVSAELTDEGSQALSGTIGPAVEHVEGEVLRVDSAGIELSVLQVESFRGNQSDWTGEPVLLPRIAVAGWQQRRLSVGGTGFVGGLVLGGLYAMYRLLGGPGLFQGGRGGGAGSSQ
jgi:hypothetical protein